MTGAAEAAPALTKAPTGIPGLDEVTHGGLPQGRPTLVCGGPGSGKTMLALQFLVEGAQRYDEPGVFMTFEETQEDITHNAASLGFDIPGLVESKRLWIDPVEIDNLHAAGEFDLEGLLIRVGHAVDKVGARRIAFDTLENLFAGIPDPMVLRAEVNRLFRWLKRRGLTAVVTAEAGERSLSRNGMEEYASDCVIALEQNLVNQVATRRLRIIKYRGSAHGTNQYPFVIDENGFAVVPITGAGLRRPVSDERVSLGVPGLDELLGGGPYRGSTLLVSGTAGTGKTTLATHAADATCARGERCTYYSFEQGADTIIRDAGELGRRLRHWVDAGLLRFEGSRPTARGLDEHLASMRRHIHSFQPRTVVLDPISGFGHVGAGWETKNMLTLLIDTVAESDATLLMTSLTEGGAPVVSTDIGVSSLADVWIMIEDLPVGERRERSLSVVKARGTDHSTSQHRVRIDDQGMHILGAREASG